MHLLPNTYLHNNKYRIVSTISQGGFGITYKAEDLALGRIVAIKEFFFSNHCARKPESNELISSSFDMELVSKLKARFIEEARRLAKLNHQNIVAIHDVFEENDTAYFVMEYIEGGSLEDLVKREGRVSTLKAIDFIKQIGSALSYLHKRKICHLDIKPANILLDENGTIKLIDFGVSKQYDDEDNHTTTFLAVSKGYAPLEQYSKNGVKVFQPASDIYALGATLYFLLSGQQPLEASTLVTTPLPCIINVPDAVNQTISKAMSVKFIDRQQTVNEFIQQIKDDKQPISTTSKQEPKVPEIPNDATEIVSENYSSAIIKSRKELFFNKAAKGILWSLVFLGFMQYIYVDASIKIFASVFHLSLKALKISSMVSTALSVGIGLYILFFCFGYEFIKNNDSSRNLFSLLSAFVYYAVLVLFILIIPNSEKLMVRNWFFASATIFPFILYFVRYVLFSKIWNKYFANRNTK